MSDFDPAKLKALQARLGGKPSGGGAKAPIRRKVAPKAAAPSDAKLQTALKKLNVTPLNGVEEVNMFKEDGVLHFSNPKVHAAAGSNTYAIYGHGQHRELTDLMPSVLSQLGPDTMANLRRIAEQYQAQQTASAGGAGAEIEGAEDPAEEVPELVEAAAESSESKKGDLEDVN
ncbi:hypothetical protein JCM6882_001610 [Rhodosporidiobolus microsporus]